MSDSVFSAFVYSHCGDCVLVREFSYMIPSMLGTQIDSSVSHQMQSPNVGLIIKSN